jgi:phosphoglycolate phosphatase
MIKLLITDLDDTLYSWISFFVPAFYEMVGELSKILNVPQNQLLTEYKALHQQYGNVEHPFITLELPSVIDAFPNQDKLQIKKSLNEAFHKFNSVRKYSLKLYPGVYATLELLYKNDVTIVGYSESAEENGFYRLKKLNIADYFSKVYLSNSSYSKQNCQLKSEKTEYLDYKKPNASVLKKICEQQGCDCSETVYVGDSITKDIYMAIEANITAVWANYHENNENLYNKLVNISHWTKKDFENEGKIRKEWIAKGYKPDYEISDFREIIPVIFGTQSKYNYSSL